MWDELRSSKTENRPEHHSVLAFLEPVLYVPQIGFFLIAPNQNQKQNKNHRTSISQILGCVKYDIVMKMPD